MYNYRHQQARVAPEKADISAALPAAHTDIGVRINAVDSQRFGTVSSRLLRISLTIVMICCVVCLVHYGTKPIMQLGDFVMGGLFILCIVACLNVIEEDYAKYVALPKMLKVDSIKRPRTRAGYVYILRALHDPTIFKIGRTNNPDNRLRTFNVKLPFDVEYLCVLKTDDMYVLEYQLHLKFADKRLSGEWFSLSANDLDYINGMKQEA